MFTPVPCTVNLLHFTALKDLVVENWIFATVGFVIVVLLTLIAWVNDGSFIAWLLGGTYVLLNILDVMKAPDELLAVLSMDALKNPAAIKDFMLGNIPVTISWLLLLLGTANMAALKERKWFGWLLLAIPLPGLALLAVSFLPSLAEDAGDFAGGYEAPPDEVHLDDEQLGQIEAMIEENANALDMPIPPCEHCGSQNVAELLKKEDPNYREWNHTCSDGTPNFAYGSNTLSYLVAVGYVCKDCNHQFFAGYQNEMDLNFG